ncbi:MAG: DNA-processing protein DprA [Bacteroidaceae bacterium]|nr:DNA-processing protein DprA [Bacteroidaceae bacterium]
MPEDELTALLTLNRIDGLGCIGAKYLYKQFGSAQEIFRNREHLKEIIPGIDTHVIDALCGSGYDSFIREELEFIEKHGIRCVTPADSDYPVRLLDCDDAPLVLFSLGNVNYNTTRTVGIVGTRKATDYGRRMCHTFVKELHELCPDITIVSGLAYGIDIESHKAALEAGFPTIGVLAHGLDMIYPSAHRSVAKQMLDDGGLVTEFMSRTAPLGPNFVRRNRIIAGLSDAVVVVESAAKSGSLITAEIAGSYNRECFAFPGSVGDPYSVGCNELIRDNRASLITSALDFVNALNWNDRDRRSAPVQKELFPELTADENRVYQRIRLKAQGVHISTLMTELNIPYPRLSTILFTLEMKALIMQAPGSLCKPL